MTVYVIIKDTRYDYEGENDVQVFSSLEKAKKELQVMVKQYRKDAQNDEWVIETDDEMSFEAYEDGYECQNHYFFNITKLPVQ